MKLRKNKKSTGDGEEEFFILHFHWNAVEMWHRSIRVYFSVQSLTQHYTTWKAQQKSFTCTFKKGKELKEADCLTPSQYSMWGCFLLV